MKTRKFIYLFFLGVLLFNICACAPSGYETEESGFLSGIWHGLIIVFSLVGKLIGLDIGVFAENNTGFLYWLGVFIGIGGLGGGYMSSRK